MDYIPSYTDQLYDDLYLEHHGILGQKWGVRRYQDENGKLTAEGKQKYAKKIKKLENKINTNIQKMANAEAQKQIGTRAHTLAMNSSTNNLNRKLQAYWSKSNSKHSEKAWARGKKKANSLLEQAGNLGVTRVAVPTVRTGRAYCNGLTMTMPINSVAIRLE